ncbi:MAG: SWIM zinc finger family protein, partial [Ilumatobacteraceae bacterium]
VAALLETKAAMVAEVEEQSAHHSSLIDTVVSLAIDGGTTPVGVTEPARPTMGLLEETLSLLEQFRTTAPELAALDNGVREYRFASSSSPGTYYDVMVVNGVPDCTCPGFAYGSMCWHAKAALRGDTSKAVVSA